MMPMWMTWRSKLAYFLWACTILLVMHVLLRSWPMSFVGKLTQGFYVTYPELPNVNCDPGRPCDYPEEMDLRIIVLTYNRANSLSKLLYSLDYLDMDGDNASLEIWVDRGKNGEVHKETVNVAESFTWSKGSMRVHIQKQHAGIYGQWIDTWRPRLNSKEVALFLEDDLSVSSHTWKWLKAVNKEYKNNTNCYGFTLQSENVNTATSGGPLKRPKDDVVIMYQLIGSWGFSPVNQYWRDFQDWFHNIRKNTTFHPYVNGLIMTNWYKEFEKRKTNDSMWTMWFIYYTSIRPAYCLYSNLNKVYTSKSKNLCVHRQEPGLHYHGNGRGNAERLLLSEWKDEYVNFPKSVKKYNFDGTEV